MKRHLSFLSARHYLTTTLGALALVAISAATAQTTLRLSSWAPPMHPVTTEILGGWAKDVERVTEGRVKVDILKSPLGAPTAYYDLIRNGVVDVGFITHDFTPNRFALTRVAELPMLGGNAEDSSVALWRTQHKFFDPAKEHANVKVLGLMVHGPGYLYTMAQAPTSLEALRGQKIRATAGIPQDLVTALGAVAVPAPPPKSYEVMMNGVVDGTIFPAESIAAFNLAPLIKHVLKVPGGFYKSTFAILMNERKWNSLSKQDQEAIWSVSGEELSRRAGQVWDKSDRAAEAIIHAANISEYIATGDYLEAIKQRLTPLSDAWNAAAQARGVDATAALEYFKLQLHNKP